MNRAINDEVCAGLAFNAGEDVFNSDDNASVYSAKLTPKKRENKVIKEAITGEVKWLREEVILS